MADLSKVLDNVEQELHSPPAAVERFAPQRHRDAITPTRDTMDSLEQMQLDLRKVITNLEDRFKALTNDLKRITG